MKVLRFENNNRVSAIKRISDNNDDFELVASLVPLMTKLMMEKPMWEFKVEQPFHSGKATCIHIFQDGEELGTVDWRWKRGDTRYVISNDRINDQRQRGDGYATKDLGKAILKIKKMFSSLSLGEKMGKAHDRAEATMNQANHQKYYAHKNLERAMEKQMLEYVQNAGWQAFVEHVKEHDPTTYNTISKRDEAYAELMHVKEINETFGKGEAILVLREGSVYIVKSDKMHKVYSDADLPEFMRVKLGMLKLVEDKAYITGMGFRTDENTFVVMKEKEDE
jgi:hypothetical protein